MSNKKKKNEITVITNINTGSVFYFGENIDRLFVNNEPFKKYKSDYVFSEEQIKKEQEKNLLSFEREYNLRYMGKEQSENES